MRLVSPTNPSLTSLLAAVSAFFGGGNPAPADRALSALRSTAKELHRDLAMSRVEIDALLRFAAPLILPEGQDVGRITTSQATYTVWRNPDGTFGASRVVA